MRPAPPRDLTLRQGLRRVPPPRRRRGRRGGDGPSLRRWLGEKPRDRGGTLPAIAVTAYYRRYPPAEVTGWAAYFRKPLDVDEFVRTIAAIFRRPGANR